jgi:phage shock protein C
VNGPLVREGVRRHDVDMNQLVRPHQGRLLAGVCSGIAERFGCSVIPVRILTVLGVVFFGLSIWVYILLWILIPAER